jgi:hypothetical protein
MDIKTPLNPYPKSAREIIRKAKELKYIMEKTRVYKISTIMVEKVMKNMVGRS